MTDCKKIIYIDWENRRVISKDDFLNTIDKKAEELYKDDCMLGDWVTSSFCDEDIGKALRHKELRETLLNGFNSWCKEEAKEMVEEGIEEIEV